MNNLIRDLKEIASDGEALIYCQMVPQPVVKMSDTDGHGLWEEDDYDDGKFWAWWGRCGDGFHKRRSSKHRCDYNIGDPMWADDGWQHDDPSEDCVKFSGYINKIDVVKHRGKYCWAFWCQEQPVEN